MSIALSQPTIFLFMYSLFSLLFLLLVSGALHTRIQTKRISRRYAPTGAFCEVDGCRIHYHRRLPVAKSNAEIVCPTLVFLHGASGNSLDLKNALEHHFPKELDLIFLDRPGLGHSTRRREHAAPLEQAKTIGAFLERIGVEEYVVVGHSLGAAVAAALGLVRPREAMGLAFLAPATHPWPTGVALYYRLTAAPVFGWLFCRTLTLPLAQLLAKGAMKGVFKPDRVPPDYNEAIGVPLLFRPRTFRANCRDVSDLKKNLIRQSVRYPELQQASLVITGDADAVVMPEIHSAGLMRDLPNARLIELSGLGHMPHYVRPDVVAREIKDLAEKLKR